MMTMRAAATAAVLTLFAHAQDQDRIRALIDQLGDDSADAREAATTELAKIGDAAEKALERAAKSRDPEVAARANQLLVLIDKKNIGKYLSVEVKFPERALKVGDPVPVEISIKNASRSGVWIYTRGFDLNVSPTHSLSGWSCIGTMRG